MSPQPPPVTVSKIHAWLLTVPDREFEPSNSQKCLVAQFLNATVPTNSIWLHSWWVSPYSCGHGEFEYTFPKDVAALVQDFDELQAPFGVTTAQAIEFIQKYLTS